MSAKVTRFKKGVHWKDQDLGGDRKKTAKKTICIVRYGGFGDMLQVAALLPIFKRLGYYICINTQPSGYNILKHNAGSNPRKALPVIEKVAQKLDIDLQETKFLQECIFTLRKQAGAEIIFLRLWKTLSYVFEMQGIYAGEGNVMGLAAAKVGLTVRCDKQDRFPMFKDNMEKERIRKGRSNLQDKYTYFKIHREIEYPQCSILRKVMDGLTRKVVVLYRWLRLRYMANQDPEFRRLV